MNSNRFIAFIHLARPINALFAGVAISLVVGIAMTSVDWMTILLAGFTGILVTASSNAINDVYDVEIDRINRPERPLAAGILTRKDGFVFWGIGSVISLIVNVFLGLESFLFVIGATVLLFFYSSYFKRTPLLGNFLVAFMTGTAFLYAGSVIGSYRIVLLPALFAFLVNLSREIIKDVEDMDGDKAVGASTLPLLAGTRVSFALVSIILLYLVIVTHMPIVRSAYSPIFFWLILPVDFLLIIVAVGVHIAQEKKSLRILSIILKSAMILGLTAIIAGLILQ